MGVDIGSVNAKLALINEDSSVAQLDTEKITSSSKAAVVSLISRLGQKFNLDEIVTAGVSGSGRIVISKELSWSEYSSSLSIASGLLRSHPNASVIMGFG